jgi:hemerythrin-like domain-containing protein
MPTASESIAAYAAAQNAVNSANESAVGQLVVDFKALNDLIAQLQNNPGQISQQDQDVLNDLQNQAAAFSSNLSALAAANTPVPSARRK